MGTSLFHAIAAAAPNAEEPAIAVVVVTGLVLVFAILLLLMLIIKLQGAIFSSMDKNKKEAAPAAPAAKSAPAKAAAPVAKAAPAPAPKVEAGIPAEVVAAIAAAVACMDGGRYTLRSVVRKREGRSAWNMAGVIASTDPF